MSRTRIILIAIILFALDLNAQVRLSGILLDDDNNSIEYATIGIKNTNIIVRSFLPEQKR